MTGSAVRRVATTILLGALATGHQASAQETPEEAPACPTAVISQVFIQNHSIYHAPEVASEEPRSWVQSLTAWAGDLANRLHHRTRKGLIESELLFRAGDCLDQLLLDESERILRSLPFIAEADIQHVPVVQGEVFVFVDTQDDLTFKLDVRPEVDDGLRLRYLGVTEENLWGTGTLVGFYQRHEDEQRDRGMQLRTPQLARTRADAVIAGGRTRTGVFFTESVSYPFVGEIGRWAFVESYSTREDFFPYATPEGWSFTNASLPMRTRRAEASLGRRFGVPGDLTVLAAGLSREELQFDEFPGGVELVSGFNFAARDTADAATIETIRPQVAPRRATRFYVFAAKRNISFITRRGLDAVRGEQDVRVGTQAAFAFGTTVGSPVLGVGDGARELRGSVSLFGGAASDSWVFNTELNLEGALISGAATSSGTFRDILGEFDAYFYWQPDTRGPEPEGNSTNGSPGRHTVVLGLSSAGGWKNARPFQLTLGGPFGIRGYGRLDWPAGRRVIANLEDRIALEGPFSELFDLGLAVFLDVGAGWRGDVPFSTDSGLRAAAGAGFRVAFPSGGRQVVRLDVAVPVHHGGFRDYQFRIGYDATSLLAPFRDRQVQRSRGAGPSPVFLGGR